jgi:CubicO group peptidase (beta-lactamase class C family)
MAAQGKRPNNSRNRYNCQYFGLSNPLSLAKVGTMDYVTPRVLKILLAGFAVLVYAADKKQAAPQTPEELHAAIGRILVETKTPGAGIAIVTRDRDMLVDGIGKANTASGRPATADTSFRICAGYRV